MRDLILPHQWRLVIYTHPERGPEMVLRTFYPFYRAQVVPNVKRPRNLSAA